MQFHLLRPAFGHFWTLPSQLSPLSFVVIVVHQRGVLLEDEDSLSLSLSLDTKGVTGMGRPGAEED